MERYFPADVSLRVSGEIADAQSLFPAARQLLSRAVRMKETGTPIIRLFQPGTDGSLIHVFLHMGLKHVYVQPAPRRVIPGMLVEEDEEVPILTISCPDMLSGVVNPGDAVLLPKENPEDPDTYAVHEFHPTSDSAAVYELDYAWQDVARLGVESDPDLSAETLQVKFPKPSMYSGAMKRVVQALYGIGNTDKAGDDGATNYAARNHYRHTWLSTDGIRKVGTDCWLVRVGRDDGVLAMPLPLFECSTSDTYRDALLDIGDVDTHAVVNEFGGLPTGETFPEGDELLEAIGNGDVLRLLTAEEMLPFYHDAAHDLIKLALWYECGWAFSESGAATEAHNTCFWYSNQAAATANISVWETDGFDTLPLADRMLRAEQWKLAITLSAFDTNRTEGAPIGSGSAVLSLVEASLMIGEAYFVDQYRIGLPFIKVPAPGLTENVSTIYYWGRTSTAAHETDYASVREAMLDISCPVFVFYIEEELEIVRHQPPKFYLGPVIRGPKSYPQGGVVNTNFSMIANSGGACPDIIRSGIASSSGDLFMSYGTNVYEHYELEGAICIWKQFRNPNGMQILVNPDNFIFTIDGVPVSQNEYYDPAPDGTDGGFVEFNTPPNESCLVQYVTTAHYIVNYHPPWLRAGRFYSTHMDLRRNARQDSVTTYDDATIMLDYADAWQEEVGLVIPPLCREGCLFVRYFGGLTDNLYPTANTMLDAGIQQRGLFPGLGVGAVDFATLPADEVNYTSSVGVRWNSVWTSMLQYQVHFGASVNAGHTKCGVVCDGVYRSFYAHDWALEYFNGGTIPVIDLTASYLGTAGGIDVTGKTAVETTFVGSV